jgi:hypothetical protein
MLKIAVYNPTGFGLCVWPSSGARSVERQECSRIYHVRWHLKWHGWHSGIVALWHYVAWVGYLPTFVELWLETDWEGHCLYLIDR